MAKSQKTIVIERIFDILYDPATKTLSRSVVTSRDIQEAKAYCNAHMGASIKLDTNPFNFMKDIVRGKSAAKIWPQSVRDRGYVGEQRTGDSSVFEFVPFIAGSETSFDEDFRPTEETPHTPVQSLSLPVASKALGRRDESWLLQVAVNLRIIETHFATGEKKQIDPAELSHLQMDIKLRKVQIDALFIAQLATPEHTRALITVEAKQGNQRILTEQVSRQVRAAFDSTDTDTVIPTAIAAIREVGIYVVEFKLVKRHQLSTFTSPEFHRDALFVLQPPVTGI